MPRKIRFKRGFAPYTTGEVATFDDDRANRIVETGAAVYVDEDNEEPSPSKRKRRSLNRQMTTD